jgi:S-formylglutathione hydrolase FrmB
MRQRSPMRRARRTPGLIGALAALAVLSLSPAPPALAARGPATPADAAGIHVVAATWLDQRLLDVTVSTAALAQPDHVRVLVPSTYAAAPRRRYPSIYLLHGCAAGRPSNGLEYREWTDAEHAETVTANAQAIVVMPEGGGGGFYTDWFNGGRGGPPQWETFHVSQLVPFIDANFRTIADRGQRAIAGLSMGGFGSLSYASRHPDVFGAAASFSGAADLTNPVDEAEGPSTAVVDACAAADGGAPDSTFGSHAAEELNWFAHDPARQVENLGNTALYLYTGNGAPGPLDRPGAGVDPIEVLAHLSTVGFHDQLVAAGIPSFFDDYGPGTHSAPYWERDLTDVLPRFMARFAAAPRRPATITFKTALPAYDTWGWHVEVRRTAAELSVLSDAGRDGFTLSGSGAAKVVTARLFRPRGCYSAVVRSGAGQSTATLTAARDGRLRLDVPLGPPNPDQEYTAAAAAHGTNVFTTSVTIQAAGKRGRDHGRQCRPHRRHHHDRR